MTRMLEGDAGMNELLDSGCSETMSEFSRFGHFEVTDFWAAEAWAKSTDAVIRTSIAKSH